MLENPKLSPKAICAKEKLQEAERERVWHFPEELCREQQPRKGFQCLAGEDEESVSTMPLNRNSGLSQNHSLGAKAELWILISLW